MTKGTDRSFIGPGGLDAASFARWYRDHLLARWKALDIGALAKIAAKVEAARDQGKQVFILGNGGSAATASHMAVDFSKTAEVEGKPQLRCLSLTDNVAFLTAIGNDIGYDQIFSRQLDNVLNKGDLVILISGSGNSPSVIEAVKLAKSRGADTIGLVGFDGGALKGLADLTLHIDSKQYGVVEDLHVSIGHIIAFYLKQKA